MHLYNLTLQNSACITHSVTGNFTSLASQKVNEIVVAQSTHLTLYRTTGNLLEKIYTQPTYSTIRSLEVFRMPGGSTKDYLVMGNDSGRIIILEFDERENCFVKVHQETFGKTGCRRIVPGQYLAVDPKGRAVMISAVEKQKFVYVLNRDDQNRLTISSPLEAHKSHTLVYGTVGIDVGYENPMFACLEVDYQQVQHLSMGVGGEQQQVNKYLTFYELDLGLNHVVKKHSVVVDRSAHFLIAVPGGSDGPSGVLVASENYLTYYSVLFGGGAELANKEPVKSAIPRRVQMPVARGLMIVASGMHKSKKKTKHLLFFIIQSEVGDLYKVTLDYDENTKIVSSIDVRYFDTTPVANSINVLRSGHLFLASEFGNHEFYRFKGVGENEDVIVSEMQLCDDTQVVKTIPLFNPRPLKNLVKVQESSSSAPFIDFKMTDLLDENQSQIYALCGRAERSSIRILRHGTPVHELAISPLSHTCNHVFTIEAKNEETNSLLDKYILISFDKFTMVLSIGESVDEVVDSGFILNTSTILARGGMGTNRDAFLQVHPHGVYLFHLDGRTSNWDLNSAISSKSNRVIQYAAANSMQVCIVTSDGQVIYFEYDHHTGQMVEISKIEMLAEVTCVALGNVPQGRSRTRFLALGCASDNNVRILSVGPDDCLTVLSRLACDSSEPESVVIDEQANGDVRLVTGLGNGVVKWTRIDQSTGDLSDTRTKLLGTKSVRLVRMKLAADEDAVLALSSRSWLMLNRDQRRVWVPLSYSPLVHASGLYTEAIQEGGIVALAMDMLNKYTLRVLNVNRAELGQMFFETSIPCQFTPRKLEILTEEKKLIVIETDHNRLDDQDESAMRDEGEEAPEKLDERQYGRLRAAPRSGLWSSCISIYDPTTLERVHTVSLTDLKTNEAAFSMALVSFQKSTAHRRTDAKTSPNYLVVGTAVNMNLYPNAKQRVQPDQNGFLRLYQIVNTNGQISLNFVHATPVKGIPQAIIPFRGQLLAGIGNTLRLYELGQKQLLRKCELRDCVPQRIVTLNSDGNRIYVGDMAHSFHFVKYDVTEGAFKLFADDQSPHWLTCAQPVDYDTIAGADKFGNIFISGLPQNVRDDESENTYDNSSQWVWQRGLLNGAPNKLQSQAGFFVGEVVTKMQFESFAPGAPKVLIYVTITGSLGVVVPFAHHQVADMFQSMEMTLRELSFKSEQTQSPTEAKPIDYFIGGRDHLSFRSSYFPVKSVVDGDLCEMLLKNSLTSSTVKTMQCVSEALGRTETDIEKMIEHMRSIYGL